MILVRYLTRDEVETINKFLAIRYGFKHVVLLPGILDLCIDSPKRIVFGQEIYPNKIEKAAALMRELNKLHPFLYGNKRTAYVAAKTFLELNDYRISPDEQIIVNVSVQTASCLLDTPDLFSWMQNLCKRVPWQPIT